MVAPVDEDELRAIWGALIAGRLPPLPPTAPAAGDTSRNDQYIFASQITPAWVRASRWG